MSFILEALRKSEHERQRKIGPSLADVQIRPQRSEKPWWAFAVGALLLINLAVLLVVLIRGGGEAKQTQAPAQVETLPPPAATQVPTRSTAVGATPPPAYSPRPASSASPLAAEAARGEAPYTYPPEQPTLAAAAAVPDGPPIVRPIQPPTVAPAPAPVQRPAPEETEILPTLSELSGSGMSLPDLHLDIHVHSPDPSQRFIFVNMRKYVEGQTLSEGPTIERITADGVILNHRGMRFLLPRQ